jgi:hypothetical protein
MPTQISNSVAGNTDAEARKPVRYSLQRAELEHLRKARTNSGYVYFGLLTNGLSSRRMHEPTRLKKSPQTLLPSSNTALIASSQIFPRHRSGLCGGNGGLNSQQRQPPGTNLPTEFETLKRQGSAVSESDSGFSEIVGGHFHVDPIANADTDEVLAHFSRDMRQDFMSIGESDAKHGAR